MKINAVKIHNETEGKAFSIELLKTIERLKAERKGEPNNSEKGKLTRLIKDRQKAYIINESYLEQFKSSGGIKMAATKDTKKPTPKKDVIFKKGQKLRHIQTGQIVTMTAYDPKAKTITYKNLTTKEVKTHKEGYLKIGFSPELDAGKKAPKKATKKATSKSTAPKEKKPTRNKRTVIAELLTKGGKLEKIVEDLGKAFPEGSDKENPGLVKTLAIFATHLGAGRIVDGKYIPFVIVTKKEV